MPNELVSKMVDHLLFHLSHASQFDFLSSVRWQEENSYDDFYSKISRSGFTYSYGPVDCVVNNDESLNELVCECFVQIVREDVYAACLCFILWIDTTALIEQSIDVNRAVQSVADIWSMLENRFLEIGDVDTLCMAYFCVNNILAIQQGAILLSPGHVTDRGFVDVLYRMQN